MTNHSLDVFRNSDIDLILMGIPSGHKHLRLVIKSGDKYMVFQEATVAAIVRAYVNIKTHPRRRAVKMVKERVMDRKQGYAEYQLIEVVDDEEVIIEELDKLIGV